MKTSSKLILGIFASLIISMLIFSSSVEAKKIIPSKSSNNVFEETTNYFSMGTLDGQAIFNGTYDSISHNFNGEVRWANSPIVRVGQGRYFPYGINSGLLYVKFYDPHNPMDPGMIWFGGYGESMWALNYNNAILKGIIYQPFQ